MDRRRSRRWPRQLDVRFWKRGEEGHPTHAVSTNVSKTGIFLRTQQVLPSGTRLRLEVSCAGRSFVSEGVVMRALRTPASLQAAMPSGMGVRFLRIEELIEDLMPGINLLAEERVQETSAAAPPVAAAPAGAGSQVPAPAHPSAAATATAAYGPPAGGEPIGGRAVFPLRFRDREQFQTAFSRDIQTGGLFISVERPPAMDAVVDVEVSVEGVAHAPVRLQARVVHRMESPAGTPAGNLLAGMGVQFLDVGRAVEQLRVLLGS
jgi:Tfp pilus assembly protein PilZ